MIVFTDSPCHSALFRSSRHLVGLPFYARIHNMVPAGGMVTNHNNPGSEHSHLRLLHFKVFLAQADAGVTLGIHILHWRHFGNTKTLAIVWILILVEVSKPLPSTSPRRLSQAPLPAESSTTLGISRHLPSQRAGSWTWPLPPPLSTWGITPWQELSLQHKTTFQIKGISVWEGSARCQGLITLLCFCQIAREEPLSAPTAHNSWRREDGSSPRTQKAPLRSPDPAGLAQRRDLHPSIHLHSKYSASTHSVPGLLCTKGWNRTMNKTVFPLAWPSVLVGGRDFKAKQNMPKQVNKDVDDAKVPMGETNEVIPQRNEGVEGWYQKDETDQGGYSGKIANKCKGPVARRCPIYARIR